MLGLLSFMSLMMLYNVYLRFYPFKTVVINKIELLTPSIKQGGILKYRVDYCRYTDAPTTVYKTVQDVNDSSLRYPMASTDGVSVPGCHVIDRSVQIDPLIPSGVYYLDVTSLYDVNEVQTSRLNFKVGNFTIK